MPNRRLVSGVVRHLAIWVMLAAVVLLGGTAPANAGSHYDQRGFAYDGPSNTTGIGIVSVGELAARPVPSAAGAAGFLYDSSAYLIATNGTAVADDVPTVVFSRGRAPGIAQNFDDAVANGAPTQLNRVDAAIRDANRRAALRGQPAAPAGQSLDEYPFACSAQGGCGSFVRAVPVGEQSYQGGVLSRFFQDYGIGVGDPFNVVFGP